MFLNVWVFLLESSLNFITISGCCYFYPLWSRLFCSIEYNRTVIQILIYFSRLKKSRCIMVFCIFSALMALNKINSYSCVTDRVLVFVTQ